MGICNLSKEDLEKEYQLCGSVRGIGYKYGLHPDTIRKRMKKLGVAYKNWEEKVKEKKNTSIQHLIDSISPPVEKHLQLTGDWVITSDWHIPAMSVEWFEILKEVSLKQGVQNLIIGGDFLNLDLLSYFWSERNNINTPSIAKELEVAKMVMRELEAIFKEIVWLIGNHERRFIHTVKYGLEASTMLFLLEAPIHKYTINNQSFCYLDSIRITHPKTYRQIKLSVSRDLASKYNCPVLQAHGHFFSLGYSRGGHLIGDTGGLFDPTRIGYLTEADSTHPVWNNGFFVYKNKKLYPYSNGIGDY